MSEAIVSEGILIQRGNGATPTEIFTTVGEITDFDGPGGSASVIDVTNLESTAKEKLMGLKDEGQFSFNANLVPGDVGQTGLRTDRDNRTLRNFKVILTDAGTTTLTFSAYVLGFSISGAVDDKVGSSITLEISGNVTWA
jgi:predicted secreted protein